MSRFLFKYKRGFGIVSLALAMMFGLSSVSIAYTSVFCKMKMEEMKEKKSCCCKMSEEESGMSCSEIPVKNEVRFEKPDGCCCVVTQSEATERNSAPAVAVNTTTEISHEGSLLFELPTPNNIPTLKSILPAGKIVSDGRSVLTFNSVLRI
jgi:hypothetical protein